MDELKNLNRTLGFYFFKPKKPKFGLFRFLGFFKKKPKNLGFLKPCQTALVEIGQDLKMCCILDLLQFVLIIVAI